MKKPNTNKQVSELYAELAQLDDMDKALRNFQGLNITISYHPQYSSEDCSETMSFDTTMARDHTASLLKARRQEVNDDIARLLRSAND